MKRTFFLLLCLSLTHCALAKAPAKLPQPLKSISFIDRNGMAEMISLKDRLAQYQRVDFLKPQPYQKVLRIYERDPKGNIAARITTYHPNGQPKQYLDVLNSRAFGIYQEWHENGCPKLQVRVIGGEPDVHPTADESRLFDGPARVWDSEGNPTADILYCKGSLQGDSLYFHKNGAIWKRIPYSENEIHGTSEIYLDNGQLLQSTAYVAGVRNGLSKRYWPGGCVAAEEHYCDNRLETARYFDQQQAIVAQIDKGHGYRAVFGKCDVTELHEYRHGIPEGAVKVFGTDKQPTRIYHVKNNLKHGEEIEYYELPQLRHLNKLSISWYEGKVQGIVKTWYDNGVQESKREMSNNIKNGISTAWYKDGSLMLIEEYDHDKLMRGMYYRRGDMELVSQVTHGNGIVTLFDAEGHFLQKITYSNGVPSVQKST